MPTTIYLNTANVAIVPNATFTAANTTFGTKIATIFPMRGGGSTTIGITGTGADILIGYWVARDLQGFTLSGTTTSNIWGDETNNNDNYGFRTELYRWIASSKTLSSVISTMTTAEFTTTAAAVSSTNTNPVSTTFLNGDALVIAVYFAGVGTAGSGRTLSMYYGGTTNNAIGDSYITLNETVNRRRRQRNTT